MKKWKITGLTLLMFIMLPVTITHAQLIEHALSFRAIVEKGDVIYEYNFLNPDEFKFERGDKVYRGKVARDKVQSFYQDLNFSKDATINDMVASLKNKGYKINSLSIRYIDENDELYTWVWPVK